MPQRHVKLDFVGGRVQVAEYPKGAGTGARGLPAQEWQRLTRA